MRPGRRGFIGSGLAAGVSLAAPMAGAAPSVEVSKTTLDDFIKMRGSLDNRMVIGSVVGQYNGVVDGETRPLFGVVSAVFSRYKEQDGGYGIVEFEEAYYTDLATGKVLTHLKNPYTNETVAVPTYDGPTDKVLVTRNLQFHTDSKPTPGVHVAHFAEGPDLAGDDIVFVERVSVSVAAAAGKPGFKYVDHTTLRSKRSNVSQSAIKMAGSQTHFEATCSWRPWLNMGDHPGHMTASGSGGFGVKFADLPASWLDATAALKPDLLKHPESRLE
jgi:hypothetical protein